MKIAVVGSGISGLGAAYYLGKNHHIDLYESENRLGGHTHTHQIFLEKPIKVDSGFIVFNDLNYPNLIKFFKELNIETDMTDMSFAVTSEGKAWSSNEFKKISTFINPQKLIFLKNIFSFNKAAYIDLHGITFNEWLEINKFSTKFVNEYVLPMTAAIWSTPIEKIGDYPIESMLAFLRNHGLVKLINRPKWRYVINGSSSYIDAILNTPSINNIFKNEAPSISRQDNYWTINTSKSEEKYDALVIATHANQAPKLLESYKSFSFMYDFSYSINTTILHTDESFMPTRKKLWSSWNSFRDDDYEYVTYWMNNLQHFKSNKNLFVTVGTFPQIKEQHILKVMKYEHPLFDFTSREVKKKIKELQGLDNLYFAGAYQGYGFHEDGLSSALSVVRMINNAD